MSPYGDGESSLRFAEAIAAIRIFGNYSRRAFSRYRAAQRPFHDKATHAHHREAGVNHSGSLETALALVDAAAEAGADIVKFQTFNANSLAGRSAVKADYQQRTTDASESQHAMLQRLELPHSAHHALIARAKQRGIEFLSTPFDQQSFEFLLSLRLLRIKIGSGDLTNAPLLHAVARTGATLILSTGMATLGEVEEALGVLAHGYSRGDEAPGIQAFRAAWRDPAARLHLARRQPAPLHDGVSLSAGGREPRSNSRDAGRVPASGRLLRPYRRL